MPTTCLARRVALGEWACFAAMWWKGGSAGGPIASARLAFQSVSLVRASCAARDAHTPVLGCWAACRTWVLADTVMRTIRIMQWPATQPLLATLRLLFWLRRVFLVLRSLLQRSFPEMALARFRTTARNCRRSIAYVRKVLWSVATDSPKSSVGRYGWFLGGAICI